MKPSVASVEFTDEYGNLCQRLSAPHGPFSIYTSADMMTSDTIDVARGAPFDAVATLPDAVLTYVAEPLLRIRALLRAAQPDRA